MNQGVHDIRTGLKGKLNRVGSGDCLLAIQNFSNCSCNITGVGDCTELKNKHLNFTSSCGLFLTLKKRNMISFHVIIHTHKWMSSTMFFLICIDKHRAIAYFSGVWLVQRRCGPSQSHVLRLQISLPNPYQPNVYRRPHCFRPCERTPVWQPQISAP
jgi:hypothetical protein